MAHAKHPADKTGAFMRDVEFLITTETEYYTNKTDEKRRLVFLLRKKVDDQIAEYFKDFPNERPGLSYYAPNDRLSWFVRLVKQMRLQVEKYRISKNRLDLGLMVAKFREVEDQYAAYYKQYPDQAPTQKKEQTNPQLVLL